MYVCLCVGVCACVRLCSFELDCFRLTSTNRPTGRSGASAGPCENKCVVIYCTPPQTQQGQQKRQRQQIQYTTAPATTNGTGNGNGNGNINDNAAEHPYLFTTETSPTPSSRCWIRFVPFLHKRVQGTSIDRYIPPSTCRQSASCCWISKARPVRPRGKNGDSEGDSKNDGSQR